MHAVVTRTIRALPATLLVLISLGFLLRAYHGIGFITFFDESEHLLGGKMLNAGNVLYRDFITQHGPVTFMLTQAFGALRGWKHSNDARWISALLTLGATACVFTSPSLARTPARLWGAALFLGLATSAWLVQSVYLVSYHTIGGAALAAALALCVIPLWLGEKPSAAQAAGAGACLLAMSATAYSFAPAALCLGASIVWTARRSRQGNLIRFFLAGGLAAGLAVLGWMLIFGDFLGYLAFHFAENQFVFSQFGKISLSYFLATQVPSLAPEARMHSAALLYWTCGILLLLALDLRRKQPSPSMAWPILLGAAGMMSLNIRGGTGFQDDSFQLGSMALLAVALPTALARWTAMAQNSAHALPALAGGSTLIGLCVLTAELNSRQAIYAPFNIRRAEAISLPLSFYSTGRSNSPMALRIRALTRRDETILAVPYSPNIYMEADRPPMRRYFYQLPWDAAYAQTPYFGQTHDLCADLPKDPPVVIYYNRWVVWGRWDMQDYLPCFFTYLHAHYTQAPDLPDLYIRNDRK